MLSDVPLYESFPVEDTLVTHLAAIEDIAGSKCLTFVCQRKELSIPDHPVCYYVKARLVMPTTCAEVIGRKLMINLGFNCCGAALIQGKVVN